ncbi:protein FAM81A-like isoform X2 [Denticeps clupeoides]|uniref:protein FAM81A-like isoform X2 n=1 Tax=Denticeps clupeoides TaxID=299321 RepID=UPI0010A3B4ED|nr:protein FAM81A-like isoform X2 [Denticeps clupeoides]
MTSDARATTAPLVEMKTSDFYEESEPYLLQAVFVLVRGIVLPPPCVSLFCTRTGMNRLSLPPLQNPEKPRGILRPVRRRDEDTDETCLRLDGHGHSVTVLVLKLSSDMEVLWEQARAQDAITHKTQFAIMKLEQRQSSALTDLRGRVARCDDSIAAVAADLHSTKDNFWRLRKEHSVSTKLLESKIRELENKVHLIDRKAELANALAKTQEISERDMSSDIARLKALSEEMKAQVASVQSWLKEAQESLLTSVERLDHLVKHKTLYKKLDDMEDTQRLRAVQIHEDNMEEIVDEKIHKIQERLRQQTQEIRTEMNTGFAIVHDSIGSLKAVLKAEMRLEKEQLLKQVRLSWNKGKGDRIQD